jgi:transposase
LNQSSENLIPLDSSVSRQLLAQTNLMFSHWHRVRDEILSCLDFSACIQPIRKEVKALLQMGLLIEHSTTRKTCANILKLEPALWTFVDHEGVEPTNNSAERPLRRGVIWRHRCFGTQSEAGSVFVEHILTTVLTLHQQNRDILDFLTKSCQTRNCDASAPSLRPTI